MSPTSGLPRMHNLSERKMCTCSENLLLGWWVLAVPSRQRLQTLGTGTQNINSCSSDFLCVSLTSLHANHELSGRKNRLP